jgi:hypothetical protein
MYSIMRSFPVYIPGPLPMLTQRSPRPALSEPAGSGIQPTKSLLAPIAVAQRETPTGGPGRRAAIGPEGSNGGQAPEHLAPVKAGNDDLAHRRQVRVRLHALSVKSSHRCRSEAVSYVPGQG